MARPMRPGATVTASRPDARIAYSTDVDLSVSWSAKLVQPEHMAAGSEQVAVVEVTGPQLLDGPAAVRFTRPGSSQPAGRWDGEWVGDRGQKRTLVATLTGVAADLFNVQVVVGRTVVDARTPRGTVVRVV